MAQPFVTGPCHLFLGLGALGQPLYLGTGERAPWIEIKAEWEPLFNDLGGTKVPIDEAYEGEHGFVGVDLTRWNESVYQLATSRTRHDLQRGLDLSSDIGTLMVHEAAAYPLWVAFPYNSKPAYASMPPGYRFLRAHLLGPDRHEPQGTAPKKVRCLWHCLRALTSAVGTLTLYDHDMTLIQSVPLD